MSNLAKLKKKAAEFEQKKQFDSALDAYEEVLRALEGGEDADTSLYNRVGDLQLRLGRTAEALQSYERAADLYAERGFLNNAIALCNKILRQEPGRAAVHYKLGRACAAKGFRSDARQHFVTYAELMQRSGQLDDALNALQEYAELDEAQDDLRLLLADQLARHERVRDALVQLRVVLARAEAEHRQVDAEEVRGRIRALDPTFSGLSEADDVEAALEAGHGPGRPSGPRPRPSASGGVMPELVLIEPTEFAAPEPAATEGRRARPEPQAEPGSRPSGSLLMPETIIRGAEVDLAPEAPTAGGGEFTLADLMPTGVPSDHGTFGGHGATPAGPAPAAATAAPDDAGAELEMIVDAPTSEDERAAPAAPPARNDAPGADLAMFEDGLVLEFDVDGGSPDPASGPASEPAAGHDARLTPPPAPAGGAHGGKLPADAEAAAVLDAVRRDPPRVVRPVVPPVVPPAARSPSGMPAPAVERPAPSTPIGTRPVAPPPGAAPTGGDFVNLGDLLREEEGPRSTRMVVEERAPSGDEEADFAAMLTKFKQGVAENVDHEDYDSHYDLGVAYKEMGLVEEAIASFQHALRGTERRARTYEALGQCFVERGQFAVAAAVLQRATEEPGLDDHQLVGVLYLLGRAAEAMNQRSDALRYYERVLAVDITFSDVADRIGAVEQVAT